jgi:hypothetical protein
MHVNNIFVFASCVNSESECCGLSQVMNTKKLIAISLTPWISKLQFWEPWSSCRLMGAESAELLDMDAMLNLCGIRLAQDPKNQGQLGTDLEHKNSTEAGILLQKNLDSMIEHPMKKENLEMLSKILTILIESMINHRWVFPRLSSIPWLYFLAVIAS